MRVLAIICLILFLQASSCNVQAQKAPVKPVMPDVNKMMSMTPAQLAEYKEKMLKTASAQAKEIAQQNNIKIDETRLPDFELKQPEKDIKRLAMIPLKAPSKIELMNAVQQSRQQLEAVATAPVIQEVKKMSSEQDAAQLQSSAVALWYEDKPVEALLTSVSSVQKNPDVVVAWNNLAAMFNMAGMEEKAIPILMNQLANVPDNSMLLNNIGQAFLALGDMQRAEQYLQHCLAIDELNPEANRSMGMINYFKNQFAEAQKYFEKELEVAHRRSTLALLQKKGIKINLNALRNKRTGIPHRDFFEEISLGKFRVPALPTEAIQSRPWWEEHANYMQSLQTEMLFWMNAGEITKEMRIEEGRNHMGIYSELADLLIKDLGDTYAPLLGLIDKTEAGQLKVIIENYNEQLNAAVCQQPPSIPGQAAEIFPAYEKKCCDLRTPIVNTYMSQRNALVKNRLNIVDARWKEYINGMISIVRLDPTIGRKKMVYHTVSQYLSFLITTINTGAAFEDPPQGCHSKMTTAEADSVIATVHSIDINCPQWLNVDVDLQVARLKADCSKYAIEGGKGLIAGYEKNFKTGTSTITAGVGLEQKFGNLAKISGKQLIYVSYDNNNQFSDLGFKGSAEGKIGISSELLVVDGIGKVGATLAGVEGGYTVGINSGFKGGIKGKGILSQFN